MLDFVLNALGVPGERLGLYWKCLMLLNYIVCIVIFEYTCLLRPFFKVPGL